MKIPNQGNKQMNDGLTKYQRYYHKHRQGIEKRNQLNGAFKLIDKLQDPQQFNQLIKVFRQRFNQHH